ncbi:hypothetical protein Ahy_A06g028605 [Arachis hypogaea]|uniref:Uncharacterized protein n=1 Tax=Arachis hypogaea TaxID=3818 RepID=A0A445CRD3_ARAHY|nr:hypothetical protein Ahy_A06g028605 [Arachis hypogaea]
MEKETAFHFEYVDKRRENGEFGDEWEEALCDVTASVTYDHKAIVVNGQRKILFSGSIHYPRSTPQALSFLIMFFFY